MGIIVKFSKTKSNFGYSCNYKNPDAVNKVVKYILRKNGRINNNGKKESYNTYGSIGTYHKDVDGIISDFQKLKAIHGKTNGVQIKHLIVSFPDVHNLKSKKMNKLIHRVLKFYSQKYQLVYAVHEDTDHLHMHIGINSVSFTGKKFNEQGAEKRKFETYINELFKEYI